MIAPVLPRFRECHPRIEVELVFEDRRVDIVGEGFDAGVRLSEYVERDMISVRLTEPFRFIIVGAPDYLDERGTPARPEDLLHHECLTFRSDTTGSLYAWELERGRRTWRIPVRGSVVVNDGLFCAAWAYYPSRAQSSAPLRLFVETVRELTAKPASAKGAL